MTTPVTDLEEKISSLRDIFDRSFAVPPLGLATGYVRLLAVRIGEDPFAIRVAGIAGVSLNRRVVPVPGGVPELAGLMGLHGRFLAVYSLAALLGRGAKASSEPWMVQCAADPSVGLSFGYLSGYLEVEPALLHWADSDDDFKSHVREFLRNGSIVCPVIDIPSVLGAIKKLTQVGRQA